MEGRSENKGGATESSPEKARKDTKQSRILPKK
jgi:hypothetical protein